MERTINVKGTGRVVVPPDLIVIDITLSARHINYARTMAIAAEQIENLRNALTGIGFEKTDLKTANFDVSTNYEGEHDANGNYRRKFVGYVCSHGLSIEFDLDTERLSTVLNTISQCLAEPEFSIRFTVKDKDAVSEKLLASAVKNAREKAEILAASAGVKLGDILSINYNWLELDVFSPTRYTSPEAVMGANFKSVDIEPADVNVSDTVSLVWAIS